MSARPGPQHTPRADLQRKYGLSVKQAKLANRIAAQLLACRSEEARRLLLGVGEKFKQKMKGAA